ncbi:MAG TPA: putative quinol monooxygenase [Acidimicrobiales bacterium]|nr:putative quinol monooxygenase [Acidimicrobiales bacterium]
MAAILVLGTIDLDPANRDAFIAAATKVMEATHAEEGCEHYAFTADLTDPGRFHVSEQWASAEALAQHQASAHLADFMLGMGGFGLKGASLTRWEGATPSKML